MRIIVTGYMIRFPLAGSILAYFHYVLGLRRLGHDVVYVEESGWPQSSWDPDAGAWCDWPASGLARVRQLTDRHCPDVPTIFVDPGSERIDGRSWEDLRRDLRRADLLLDVGGVCWLDDFQRCRRRALVDMDPLFGQMGGFSSAVLDRYDCHFSYGVNIGRPECRIPTRGIKWSPTVPPVVTDLWRGGRRPHDRARSGTGRPPAFTTIANWSAYGTVEHDGVCYGQKDLEFERVVDLPGRVSVPLEVVITGIDRRTAARFRAAGWRFRQPRGVRSVSSYQRFIQRSAGEFSVAKHAYVASRSGWFNDRSVCYLASGRPVVVQDTGFTAWLPANEAVLPFDGPDTAACQLEAATMDHPDRAPIAREVAGAVFGHDVVLPALVETAVGGS